MHLVEPVHEEKKQTPKKQSVKNPPPTKIKIKSSKKQQQLPKKQQQSPKKQQLPKTLFKCSECDYKNPSNENVINHIKTVHVKPFKCGQCDFTDSSKG